MSTFEPRPGGRDPSGAPGAGFGQGQSAGTPIGPSGSATQSSPLNRPEPTPSRLERLRAGFGGWPWRETAGWVALSAVGSVLLIGGSIWGWQQWSSRSEPPLDDLLPLLTAAEDGSAVDGSGGAEADDAAGADDGAQPAAAGSADAPDGEAGAQLVPTIEALPTATPAPIIVHVSGAVENAGIVEVDAGARVYEAVEAAGGTLADADTDRVNLAAPLVDGERIHIPLVGEDDPPELIEPDRPDPALDSVPTPAGAGTSAASASPAADSDDPYDGLLVDINRATAAELEQLPGVGPTIAQAIVDLRNERGPFHSVEELLLVDGIGQSKLEGMSRYVWVYQQP